ncbi:transcription elongation factor GreA [Candidatus Roizmanbacteria bacterium CG17_big_fil_post_rev_8_21_14_2_50_39_7]|uniref:Transcription elongation factor GreA n=3 Tax=Candidatus Roizmaniibacteriota TaxID=1752723 RepID=A0A2M7EK45_9BACT|nr:MAG: transcription elongation factor GreA [Candidatus Roizmanbacteria bacterium CG03_land_8_20_14_0_80_39_12]PIV70920.1 MAG: transcription elongation factor GreA [Candidatus Roizmanbacteria bacterium CG17_big_fil_post_rev_8_21_14_2_50_39_7]
MKKIQLTQEGFTNLQDELNDLQTVKRPSTVEKLQKARAMGDLKENNAYQSAKEELGELDGRIMEVQYILNNAEIVMTSPSDLTVSLGKKVTVDINGLQKIISIVGEFESDPMNGKLSTTSPIGAALIGKRVNDKVEVITPGGPIPYIILSIA